MTCHFSGNMGVKSLDLFSEQPLQVASCLLHLIEYSLNPFLKIIEKSLKDNRRLLVLIDSFGGEEPIAGGSRYLGLLLGAIKAFICQNVTALNEL